MTAQAWFNGAPADSLATSRGLHYGDGVFRTLLIHDGVLRDRERQLQKLAADARALHLIVPSLQQLGEEADALSRGQPVAVLKIVLMRRAGDRGYRASSDECDRLLQISQVPRYSPDCWTEGIDAMRSPVTLATQPLLAGIKHLNRLEQVLASRDWPASVQESILSDQAGHPVCGTRSNLFWVHDGVLRTPALDSCGVAGIMRERVLELAAELGQRCEVARADWQELYGATEAFVTNSLIGIWPLRSLDAQKWSAPGLVTQRLQAALQHPRLC